MYIILKIKIKFLILSFGQNINKISNIKNDVLCKVLNKVNRMHIATLSRKVRWLDNKRFKDEFSQMTCVVVDGAMVLVMDIETDEDVKIGKAYGVARRKARDLPW